jgi:hypothetical protein
MKWKESPTTLEKRSSIFVGASSNIDADGELIIFVVPATIAACTVAMSLLVRLLTSSLSLD